MGTSIVTCQSLQHSVVGNTHILMASILLQTFSGSIIDVRYVSFGHIVERSACSHEFSNVGMLKIFLGTLGLRACFIVNKTPWSLELVWVSFWTILPPCHCCRFGFSIILLLCHLFWPVVVVGVVVDDVVDWLLCLGSLSALIRWKGLLLLYFFWFASMCWRFWGSLFG